MGSGLSKPKINNSEARNIPEVLPLGELASVDYKIENLVFASGGSLSYSYAGAVRVLEKLGILKGIKRFAGVGTGAILASLLAANFDSSEIQEVLDQSIDDLIVDDQAGLENVSENLPEAYGWNFGTKFQDMFGYLLELKLNETDPTFLQLYQLNGKELCIIATNVDTLTIEYFHPKITPHMSISHAVFMSLSIPGIFASMTYGPGNEKCHFVNGSLLCSYPIHCFDGWLLSMDSADFILNQLENPDHYHSPQKAFSFRNHRTLGFYPIEKYRENNYKDLNYCLKNLSPGLKIPETSIGDDHRSALQKQRDSREKFVLTRKACTKVMSIFDSVQHEDQSVLESIFADKIFAGNTLSREHRFFFFPEFGGNVEECIFFLKTLSHEVSKLTRKVFKRFVEKKILAALEESAETYKVDINTLHIYFGTLFEAKRHSSFALSKADFDRTVGIFCGHIGSRNINFEYDDQTFLYFQGWNATVAYLQQKKDAL